MKNLRRGASAFATVALTCTTIFAAGSSAFGADTPDVITPPDAGMKETIRAESTGSAIGRPADAAGTNDITQEKGIFSGDSTDATFPSLVCKVGKESYDIDYRGTLNMAHVTSKWNEKKEAGRASLKANLGSYATMAAGLVDLDKLYDSVFARLKVSDIHDGVHTFVISLTIDTSVVSVDMNKLTDKSLWTAAYEAANPGQSYVTSMIVDTDESRPVTYDATTGKITVPFRLRDGLTAGDLDRDYATLTDLKLDTPAGLLSVSRENFKNTEEGDRAFLMTNPIVTGVFALPTYGGGAKEFFEPLRFFLTLAGLTPEFIDQKVAERSVGVMAQHFPLNFRQDPPGEPAEIRTLSAVALTPSYVSATPGKELPQAVLDTLPEPSAVANYQLGTDRKLALNPHGPAAGTQVKDPSAGGFWTFRGWPGLDAERAWNWNDTNTSSPCRVIPVEGSWILTKLVDPHLACPSPAEGDLAKVEGVIYEDSTTDRVRTISVTPAEGFAFVEGATTSVTCPLPAPEPTPAPTLEPTPAPSSEPTPEPTPAPASPSAPTNGSSVTPSADVTALGSSTASPAAKPHKSGKRLPFTGASVLMAGMASVILLIGGAGIVLRRRMN